MEHQVKLCFVDLSVSFLFGSVVKENILHLLIEFGDSQSVLMIMDKNFTRSEAVKICTVIAIRYSLYFCMISLYLI